MTADKWQETCSQGSTQHRVCSKGCNLKTDLVYAAPPEELWRPLSMETIVSIEPIPWLDSVGSLKCLAV